jgi:hypothetical protein
LVATASTGRDLAIGQQLLTLVQAGLFAGPVDFVTSAIGKIDQPRFPYFNQASAGVVESTIVIANGCVVAGGFTQFLWGPYATRNNRIGINQATAGGLND